MINILSYKGNANENDIEIPSHLNQNGCLQEDGLGNPYTLLTGM
jgi:hypothetical protein